VEAKNLGRGLLSLLFPANCKICQRPLGPSNFTFICKNCWDKVEWIETPHCSQCSKPLSLSPAFQDISTLLCPECSRNNSYFKKIFVPTLYEGVMKKAIHLLKYNKKRGVLRSLEKIIKTYFGYVDFPSCYLDLVVPIPLHRKKLKERGFNQAELIARIITKHFQIPLIKNNLQRVKATVTQTTLNKKERLKNIKGAFKVKDKDKFQAKNILLVDDVYTTGTTIKEAVKVLKEAKVKEIYVFTLARAS